MIDKAIAKWGLLAISLFSFTNGFISTPPSEITIGAAGVLTNGNELLLYLSFFLILGANYAGTTVLFLICKYRGKEWYDKIKLSKFVKTHRILNNIIPPSEKLISFFNNRCWLVFACRFCPCIRSIISVPAGIAGMSMVKYTIYTLSGMSIWTAFWLYIGQKMMLSYIEGNYIILSICVLVILFMSVLSRAIHKRLKK